MEELLKYFRILLIIYVVFTAGFLLFIVMIPAFQAKLIYINEEENKTDYYFHTPSDSVNKLGVGLEAEKAFLKARLLASRSDSSVLVIDLYNNIISVELLGLSLFEADIEKVKKSSLFSKYSSSSLARWSEYPFRVRKYVSSIPKLPIIYKKAPKDSIEAEKQQENFDIPGNEKNVWLTLYTDRSLKISIHPAEKSYTGCCGTGRFKYFRKKRRLERRELISSFINPEIPAYNSSILLYVSKDDARVIYRAIPEHALVIVRP